MAVLIVLTHVLVVVSSLGGWRSDRSPAALWMLLTVVALIVCACALVPVRRHPRHPRSIVPGRDGPTRLDEERILPRS